jgi:AraC family transcriptional regulator
MVKGKPSLWLKQAKELLQDQFQEQVSLNSLAEQINIHPVHLAREFRHHYQMTVGEYIRQLRIEFSCHELTSTDAPIAQIALKAGFFDQSHFCKTFKRLTGHTPIEFRTFSRSR